MQFERARRPRPRKGVDGRVQVADLRGRRRDFAAAVHADWACKACVALFILLSAVACHGWKANQTRSRVQPTAKALEARGTVAQTDKSQLRQLSAHARVVWEQKKSSAMSDVISDPKAYVDTHLNPTLEPAVVALCRARPADPVTWLAEYLIAHCRRRQSARRSPILALLQQLLTASKTPCALPSCGRTRGESRAAYAASASRCSKRCNPSTLNATLSTRTMEQVCREPGFGVQALTASTGLSLAESVVIAGERAGVDASALIGPAGAFFSYSWTGTTLGDMLSAVRNALKRLAAEGETMPFVWIDMFCASQNLLGGVYRDDANHPKGSPGYKARKEDTDHIFDDALAAVSVVIFYLSPLEGEVAGAAARIPRRRSRRAACRVDSPRPKRRHPRVVPL